MAIWYYDPINGNAANSGTSPSDAFARLSEALTAANTDGSAGQTIYAIGNLYGSASVETGVMQTTLDGLSIIGMDSNGNLASDLSNFNWSEKPIVQLNYFNYGLRQTAATTMTIRGLEFNGLNKSNAAISNFTVGSVTNVYDCLFKNILDNTTYTMSNSLFHRCRFTNSFQGPETNGTIDIESCIIDNMEKYAITKALSTNTIRIKNSLIYKMDKFNLYGLVYPIENADTNIEAVRCLFVDNYSDYGAEVNSSYIRCNSYSSIPGIYHRVNNWFGTPGSENYEINPKFVNPDNANFKLSDPKSALIGISSGRGDDPLYTFDREPLPEIIGPLSSIWSIVFTEGSGSCAKIAADFTINTVSCHKRDYNKIIDAIPFGLTVPGPISLRGRNTPYKLTK